MKKVINQFLQVTVFLTLLVIPPQFALADEVATTTEQDTATISIRDGETFIGPFVIDLPATSSAPILLAPTGSEESHEVPARSVLAQLSFLDATTTEFSISDLQYYDSFNSFIINCINIPETATTSSCFEWTYAVNNSFPYIGMDSYLLENDDVVYLIFGSQWQILTDKSSAITGELLMITANAYNPSTNLYVPLENEIVGAVKFDESYNAIEFATSTTNASGQATISLDVAGTYNIGIASTGYFPNSTLTVSSPASEPEPEQDNVGNNGGGGGGGISHSQIDIDSAIAYLANQQQSDGSFSSSFLTDWSAIALASVNQETAQTLLYDYLLNNAPTLASVTDYERHAMALEALGISPYSDTSIDYIAYIVSTFDGEQIGDRHLDNDDIFALFPLIRAGYDSTDDLIQKIVNFILSRQTENGSWDESVDMTAASIQALAQVNSIEGVINSILRARLYLETKQNADGGFGSSGESNSFSTSWVMQAIIALGENITSWSASGLNPQDYLASLQQSDGGIDLPTNSQEMRVWSTAYAIPATLGKSWWQILHSFTKEIRENKDENIQSSDKKSGQEILVAENVVATSTVELVTAPEIISTSEDLSVPTLTPQATQATEQARRIPAEPTFDLEPQTASAVTATKDGFFTNLWAVILSFFYSLLTSAISIVYI